MDWVYVIRESRDQSLLDGFPGLIAAFHALHRLLTPRHPPCALSSLTTNIQNSCEMLDISATYDPVLDCSRTQSSIDHPYIRPTNPLPPLLQKSGPHEFAALTKNVMHKFSIRRSSREPPAAWQTCFTRCHLPLQPNCQRSRVGPATCP